MNSLLPLIDRIFGEQFKQRKTEIAIVTLAIVNGANELACQLTPVCLPENIIGIVNNVLAGAIVLFLGSRLARTENAVKEVAAKQPNTNTGA